MKNKELSKKNKNDLETILNEQQLKLRDLRFGLAGSKSKNVKEQKTLKKDIARILTALKKVN